MNKINVVYRDGTKPICLYECKLMIIAFNIQCSHTEVSIDLCNINDCTTGWASICRTALQPMRYTIQRIGMYAIPKGNNFYSVAEQGLSGWERLCTCKVISKGLRAYSVIYRKRVQMKMLAASLSTIILREVSWFSTSGRNFQRSFVNGVFCIACSCAASWKHWQCDKMGAIKF